MQVRINDPLLSKRIKIEAAKQGISVPLLIDKLLYPIFYGHSRAAPKKSKY
jgi:predicted HicB family RNase H-like nuclease